MTIEFEKEVLRYLNIPSIPLKKHEDPKKSFKNGVAVLEMRGGYRAYAVATYDAATDKAPRVKKTFSLEPFSKIVEIFVVPEYMDTEEIENADLDEESRKAAQTLVDEAAEIEADGADTGAKDVPENEWCFPEITNLEEAVAWLKSYNKTNKIRGKLPTNEETIKLRLLAIWKSQQNPDA